MLDSTDVQEACCSLGHVAAACGNKVNVVEFIYGLVARRVRRSCKEGHSRIYLYIYIYQFPPISSGAAQVNDRTTTNRQQLRVYVIREKDLQNLPERMELDLRRSSFRSARLDDLGRSTNRFRES